MPGPIENPRWEKFAQLLFDGMGQSEAYVAAGYDATTPGSIKVGASHLADNEAVIARVRELQVRAARRSEIKKSDVVNWLIEDRKLARELKQVAASIRAAELVGKEIGMFVDRKEIKTGELDDIDLGELDEIRDALRAESARRAGEGRQQSGSGTEDRAVLPGPGAATPGAVPEASGVLPSGP